MLELTLIHVNEKGLDCIKIGKAWSIRVIRIRRFGNLSSRLHVSNSGTRTLFDWKCGVSVFHSCNIRIVWGLWSQSNFHDMIISIINIFWLHWIINRLVAMHPYALSHNKADDTFKRIFFNENVRISIKISLTFVQITYDMIVSLYGLPPVDCQSRVANTSQPHKVEQKLLKQFRNGSLVNCYNASYTACF